MIVIFGSIAYFLRDCKCKVGPQGPPGESVDMSNYKGNINVIGDISASGKIKSRDCELNCNKPTPDTPDSSGSKWWIWLLLAILIIVVVLFIYNYSSEFSKMIKDMINNI